MTEIGYYCKSDLNTSCLSMQKLRNAVAVIEIMIAVGTSSRFRKKGIEKNNCHRFS